MDFFKLLVGDVGIDLRRSDGRMPQHGLDAPDVGAVAQKVGGEAVAESVRMDFFHQAGFGGVIFNDPLHAPRRYS